MVGPAIIVVETGKLVVVTCVPAGQSVTVGAHEVTVCTSVDQIVLVISPTWLDVVELVVPGRMTVETGKLVVVTCVPAGQLVTVGAQDVMV